MRVLKLGTIGAALIGAGLALLAATQTWFTLRLTAAAGHTASIAVAGTDASPALLALSLAGLAIGVALLIAGRLVRIVVGVLGVAVAVCIVVAASSGSVAGGYPAITKATGVSGDASLHALIAHADGSAWPAVAIVGAVLLGLASVAAAVLGRLWPAATRRYDRVRFESPDAVPGSSDASDAARSDAIADWDDLTRGDDPTS